MSLCAIYHISCILNHAERNSFRCETIPFKIWFKSRDYKEFFLLMVFNYRYTSMFTFLLIFQVNFIINNTSPSHYKNDDDSLHSVHYDYRCRNPLRLFVLYFIIRELLHLLS